MARRLAWLAWSGVTAILGACSADDGRLDCEVLDSAGVSLVRSNVEIPSDLDEWKLAEDPSFLVLSDETGGINLFG